MTEEQKWATKIICGCILGIIIVLVIAFIMVLIEGKEKTIDHFFDTEAGSERYNICFQGRVTPIDSRGQPRFFWIFE